MRMWFTAQEMADAAAEGALPGLPTTKMGVAKLADREGWRKFPALCRPRPGSEGGGGYEYHLDLLPMPVRIAWLARHFRVASEDLQLDLKTPLNGSARAVATRDAKLAVLRMADRFRRETGLTRVGADGAFASLYNTGGLAVPAWVRAEIQRLSGRSIERYRAIAKADVNGLAHDPSAARKGKGLLDVANDGKVRIFILAVLAKKPHQGAKDVRKDCRAQFGEHLADQHGEIRPMPPLRTFQHFLKELRKDEQVVLTKLTDPDGHRNRHRLSGTNALSFVTRPNQLWQIDASPVDALCVDGRHSIYICLDIATRRMVGYVSRTPRAAAVGLLVRKAILALGVPDEIVTDNGSDFVAKATTRLFDSLSIAASRSDAYSPEQKGHVERAIKTFQHGLAEQLPGYVGHSVADRRVIENRKAFSKRPGESDAELFEASLTGAELQARVDEWIELAYSHAPHGGLGGCTPYDVAAASSHPARTVDERALDVLLMPIAGGDGLRTMSKRGIRVDHYFYMTGDVLPGAQVLVRMDPNDAGRALLFEPDGARFLAYATCIELSGVNPKSILAAARQRQAELLDETIRPIKAQMREIARDPSFIERVRDVDRRDAAARIATGPNVIQLPRRKEEHTSDQIAAAIEAAEGQAAPAPTGLSGRAAEIHEQVKADLGSRAPARAPVTTLDTPRTRFRRALDLEARIAAGERVDTTDAVWLGGYQQLPEYRAARLVHEDLGAVRR